MNKKIDELAKDIDEIMQNRCFHYTCHKCEFDPCDTCKATMLANALINDYGYRKASDVAREIFEAIYGISIGCSVENDVMRLTFEKDPYVLVVLASEFDKLRKKYESEGGE